MHGPFPEVSQPLDRGLQGQEGEQLTGCHPGGDHLLPTPRDGVPGRHSRPQNTAKLSDSSEKCEHFLLLYIVQS
jgi:hypothetical protein